MARQWQAVSKTFSDIFAISQKSNSDAGLVLSCPTKSQWEVWHRIGLFNVSRPDMHGCFPSTLVLSLTLSLRALPCDSMVSPSVDDSMTKYCAVSRPQVLRPAAAFLHNVACLVLFFRRNSKVIAWSLTLSLSILWLLWIATSSSAVSEFRYVRSLLLSVDLWHPPVESRIMPELSTCTLACCFTDRS